MRVAPTASTVANTSEPTALSKSRYLQTFYKSFKQPDAQADDVVSRLSQTLTSCEAECRWQLHRLEQKELAVICQGFAGVLGRLQPALAWVNALSVEDAESAHRGVIMYKYATMQLQACMYSELMERVHLEEFVEPQARMAIERTEVPQWALTRQRQVERLGAVAQEGTWEYQQQQQQHTKLQQLALLHVTEAEERMDIERHQLLYMGALVEVHKKRLRSVLPKQAKYAISHVLVHTPESLSLIALESTQRLAVTFDERDGRKRIQASEVIALVALQTQT